MLDLQVHSVAVVQCLFHAHLCLGHGNIGNPHNRLAMAKTDGCACFTVAVQVSQVPNPSATPFTGLEKLQLKSCHGVSLGLLCCTSQLDFANTLGMTQVPASHWSSFWSAQEMRAGAVVWGGPT